MEPFFDGFSKSTRNESFVSLLQDPWKFGGSWRNMCLTPPPPAIAVCYTEISGPTTRPIDYRIMDSGEMSVSEIVTLLVGKYASCGRCEKHLTLYFRGEKGLQAVHSLPAVEDNSELEDLKRELGALEVTSE